MDAVCIALSGKFCDKGMHESDSSIPLADRLDPL